MGPVDELRTVREPGRTAALLLAAELPEVPAVGVDHRERPVVHEPLGEYKLLRVRGPDAYVPAMDAGRARPVGVHEVDPVVPTARRSPVVPLESDSPPVRRP